MRDFERIGNWNLARLHQEIDDRLPRPQEHTGILQFNIDDAILAVPAESYFTLLSVRKVDVATGEEVEFDVTYTLNGDAVEEPSSTNPISIKPDDHFLATGSTLPVGVASVSVSFRVIE